MRTIRLFFFLALAFFACANVYPQVTIGSLIDPAAGAILDLNSTVKGGLVLSNVTIINLDLIPQNTNVFVGVTEFDENLDLRGAMVYNDGVGTSVPAGIYVWNGYCWTKNGDGGAMSPSVSIDGTVKSSVELFAGDYVTLDVISPQADTSYEWYVNTSPSTSGGTRVSTTTDYATPTSLPAETYFYYCKVISNSCQPSVAFSSVITVTVKLNPLSIPTGTGSFSGKLCFDIAFTEGSSTGCGTLSSRNSQRADFSLSTAQDPANGNVTAPYTGVQVYTFTPTGTVSKVRFEHKDESGLVIDHIEPQSTGYETQTNISTPCKVTVYYKPSLNTDLRGLTSDNALTVTLYAIYNDAANGAGEDKKRELTVSLRDCVCCGATTIYGGWQTFMCHNLGADESSDPFTWATGNPDGSGGTLGYLYQWGRNADGHQLRNSTAVTATITAATYNNAEVGTYPLFFTSDEVANVNNKDWITDGGQDIATVKYRWGSSTNSNSATTPKGINDPCPAGWKVPSQYQWASISVGGTGQGAYPATWTATGTSGTDGGVMIGNALYLPAAGYRGRNGGLRDVGNEGHYWSSTWRIVNSSYHMHFKTSNNTMQSAYTTDPADGSSVRCVPE
jgi:uncharacterized protein (TIGR02145 family)